MIKVGITGGIGSGKTTVCKMFEAMGIPIYYADDRAKALMVEDPLLKQAISDLFGIEAYIDGELNRAHIAAIVFTQATKLEQLNQLVHPRVATDAEQWFEELTGNIPFAIKEAALLHESGSYRSMDKVITVMAPEATRIDRVMARDHSSKEQVEARMRKQWTDEQRKAQTDYIINNDGSSFLITQVMELYEEISGIDLEQIKPRYPK